jgi:hypothetical protein
MSLASWDNLFLSPVDKSSNRARLNEACHLAAGLARFCDRESVRFKSPKNVEKATALLNKLQELQGAIDALFKFLESDINASEAFKREDLSASLDKVEFWLLHLKNRFQFKTTESERQLNTVKKARHHRIPLGSQQLEEYTFQLSSLSSQLRAIGPKSESPPYDPTLPALPATSTLTISNGLRQCPHSHLPTSSRHG